MLIDHPHPVPPKRHRDRHEVSLTPIYRDRLARLQEATGLNATNVLRLGLSALERELAGR